MKRILAIVYNRLVDGEEYMFFFLLSSITGRTGRAGHTGKAVTFFTEDDKPLLRRYFISLFYLSPLLLSNYCKHIGLWSAAGFLSKAQRPRHIDFCGYLPCSPFAVGALEWTAF